MKNKIIILLLTASLALNIVFFVKTTHQKTTESDRHRNPVKPRKRIIKDINGLSKSQRSALKKIIKEFRITQSEYKDQILAKRIDIIDELSNPEFNIEDLRKATEALNQIENELNLNFVESLGKISGIMNNEQRIKLLLNFSKHWFFLKNQKNRRRLK